jgi:ABC-type nickel/cobalt efflux system permease component RcnA
MSIIRLGLSDKARANFISTMSSNDYNELMQSALTPLDLTYTFAYRYARVIDYDLPTEHGDQINSGSEIFAYTSQHLALSIPTTVFFLALSALSTYREYRQQLKTKNNNSHQFIYNKFQHVTESLQERDQRIFDMNYYLKLIFSEDEELKNKYKYIKINTRTHTLNFKPITKIDVKKPSKFTRLKERIIRPAWISLNIASFVYWILWIGMGVFTGNLTEAGVYALPSIVAFGVPILAGLLYPLKKVCDYVKNKKANTGVTPEEKDKKEQKILQAQAATQQATPLFRRALLRREYDLKKLALLNQLAEFDVSYFNVPLHINKMPARAGSMDEAILSSTKNQRKKVLIAFASAVGGTYVAMQYGTWIITDFLKAVMKITASDPVLNIIGVVLLAVTTGFGIYKAYQRYQAIKKLEADAANIASKQNKQLTDLETKLDELQKSIAAKKEKLGIPISPDSNIKHNEEQFFQDIHRRGPTKTTNAKKFLKRAFQFVNGFCTGAFLARLLVVKYTAILLPAAAVVLSNPITIGIIASIGLLYGALKAYEYHLIRKEERADLMLKQHVERMECLQQQVELAQLENKLLSVKIKHAHKLANSQVVKPEAMLVSSRNLFKPLKVTRLRRMSEGHMPEIYQPFLPKVC